jgi:phosphatidylserine/phosphatidylglycerophosphate/cardiolipin synthase-like enzyme
VLSLLLIVVATAACQTVTTQRPAMPRLTSTAHAWAGLGGLEATGGAVVIDDNARAWAARWELITDARRQIDLATFIYDQDVFGLALLGALTERASAGVQVRLLLDGRGSLAMTSPLLGRDLLQELASTGHADIHVYNPPLNEVVGALITMDAVQLSAGNHNKLLIVDGALAVTGGRNVNSHYFGTLREDAAAVSDVDVLLDGEPLVAALTDVMDREFYSWRHEDIGPDAINITPQRDLLLMMAGAMDAWVRGQVDPHDVAGSLERSALARLDHAPTGRALELLRERLVELQRYPSIRGTVPLKSVTRFDGLDARIITVRSRVRGDDNPAVEAVLRAIAGARREIIIQSPSFILTPQLLKAFRKASDRGVAITLLTNSPMSSDSRIAQALFIDSWPELIARIPTLRVFVARRHQMQHAKRMLFDDDLTFIGSYNFDPFSHQMNSETIVASLSPALGSAPRTDLLAVQEHMIEYRVARDAKGRVRRHPHGHPAAGQVIVEQGPRDIAPADEIEAIEGTKTLLLSLQRLWDFDVVVW